MVLQLNETADYQVLPHVKYQRYVINYRNNSIQLPVFQASEKYVQPEDLNPKKLNVKRSSEEINKRIKELMKVASKKCRYEGLGEFDFFAMKHYESCIREEANKLYCEENNNHELEFCQNLNNKKEKEKEE